MKTSLLLIVALTLCVSCALRPSGPSRPLPREIQGPPGPDPWNARCAPCHDVWGTGRTPRGERLHVPNLRDVRRVLPSFDVALGSPTHQRDVSPPLMPADVARLQAWLLSVRAQQSR